MVARRLTHGNNRTLWCGYPGIMPNDNWTSEQPLWLVENQKLFDCLIGYLPIPSHRWRTTADNSVIC